MPPVFFQLSQQITCISEHAGGDLLSFSSRLSFVEVTALGHALWPTLWHFDPVTLCVQGHEASSEPWSWCPHPGNREMISSASVVICQYNLYHLSKDIFTVTSLVWVDTTEIYFNKFLSIFPYMENYNTVVLFYSRVFILPLFIFFHYILCEQVVQSKCQFKVIWSNY